MKELLELAAKHNTSAEVAEMLLNCSANIPEDKLHALLLLAVEHNSNNDVLKVLIHQGADVKEALQIAVEQKNADVVEMLLKSSPNILTSQLQSMTKLVKW